MILVVLFNSWSPMIITATSAWNRVLHSFRHSRDLPGFRPLLRSPSPFDTLRDFARSVFLFRSSLPYLGWLDFGPLAKRSVSRDASLSSFFLWFPKKKEKKKKKKKEREREREDHNERRRKEREAKKQRIGADIR